MPLFGIDALDDLAESTFDPEGSEEERQRIEQLNRESLRLPANAEVNRQVIRDVGEEQGNRAARVVSNFGADAANFATGLGTMFLHPLSTIEALPKLPGALVEHFSERYSSPGQVLRSLEEHPFDTLMDASGVLGGAGLVAKGLGAATKVAALGRAGAALETGAGALDPLSWVTKGLPAAARQLPERTGVPGLMQKWDMHKRISQLTHDRAEISRAAGEEFERNYNSTIRALPPELQPLHHLHVEGLIQLRGLDGAPISQMLPEEHVQLLEQARDAQEAMTKQWEDQLNLTPEAVAQEATMKAHRDLASEIEDPAQLRQALDEHYQQSLQEATEAQQMRRTVTMRTALDQAKMRQWKEGAERTKLENELPGLVDDAHRLPPQPTTPEEALALMGPKGGLYMPHSMETLTREQSTFGNFLTKVKEAIPYRHNKEALARMGDVPHPDQLMAALAEEGPAGVARMVKDNPFFAKDPASRLAGTARMIERRGALAEMLDTLGQEFGEAVGKGEKLMGNKDFMGWIDDAGNKVQAPYQLLIPHLRTQDGAIVDHMSEVMDYLSKHADDPGVSGLNLADLAERMVNGADQIAPVKKGSAYKIPTALGNEIKRTYDAYNQPVNALMRHFDFGSDIWRFATLNLRPLRVLNNVAGNMLYGAIHGVHPLSPTGFKAMIEAGRDIRNRAKGLDAGVLDLPGVAGGGIVGAERGGFGGWLEKHKSPILQRVGKWGNALEDFNTNVEDYFRAATSHYALAKGAKRRMLESGAGVHAVVNMGEEVERLKALGVNALDDAAGKDMLNFTNKVLNNYRNQSLLERTYLRRFAPFHKFYGHAMGMAMHFPFEQPVKATLWRNIAATVKQDTKDHLKALGFDYDSEVPEWMKDSVPIDTKTMPDGNVVLRMISTRGPNPFNVISGLSDEGEALAALHPLVKVAIERASGVDLFKMRPVQGPRSSYTGKTVDPRTGEVVDGNERVPLLENIGRQFWPYKLAEEVLARGRSKFDTTTLLDQLLNEPAAYKRDPKTGLELRRPTPAWPMEVLAAPFVPRPQYVTHKTPEQVRAETRVISEDINKLWRYHPELRGKINDLIEQRRGEYERKAGPFGGVRR